MTTKSEKLHRAQVLAGIHGGLDEAVRAATPGTEDHDALTAAQNAELPPATNPVKQEHVAEGVWQRSDTPTGEAMPLSPAELERLGLAS